MAQLFAENGVQVSLEDPSEEAMDGIIDSAKKQGFGDNIKKFRGKVGTSSWKPWTHQLMPYPRLQSPL